MLDSGRYELGRTLSLSRREREIIILRTTARCGCEYERGVHVADFAQLVDVLLLAGWYHAVSYAATAARVGREPWAPGFADYT